MIMFCLNVSLLPRKYIGFYFNDYLNQERLRHAVLLIETTDLKLKEIVGRVGFSSQTYFDRQFKSRYGMTPNTYRRELRVKALTSQSLFITPPSKP